MTLARVCFIHSFHANPKCNYDVELVLGMSLCFFMNQTCLAPMILLYEPGLLRKVNSWATRKGLFRAIGYVYDLFPLQGNRVCIQLASPLGVTSSTWSRRDDRGCSGIHLESHECQIGPSMLRIASWRPAEHGIAPRLAPFVCEAKFGMDVRGGSDK